MKYQDGGAFRRAIEDRLRTQSLESGIALVRLRKMIAFDRFLVRLMQAQPDAWILKGGLALQLRLGQRARTTKDIDMLLRIPIQNIHQYLVHAVSSDVGDWFQFEVTPSADRTAEHFGGSRFHIYSLLDGRPFERFHVDIGVGDPVITEAVESLRMPALLEFADIPATIFPCYPLTRQLAEKVHAYTRPHLSGESSRVKDLVDILLIAESGSLNGQALFEAIQMTFNTRRTHPLPDSLPDPPPAWSVTFRKLALEVGLNYPTLMAAGQAARCFLNPILQGQTKGVWNPAAWLWQP